MADFDQDRFADLAVTGIGFSQGFFLFRGTPDGFQVQTPSIFSGDLRQGAYSMDAGDFNADGLPDLALIARDRGCVIALAEPGGGFRVGGPWNCNRTYQVNALHADNDGKLDVLFVDPRHGYVTLFRGDGEGYD